MKAIGLTLGILMITAGAFAQQETKTNQQKPQSSTQSSSNNTQNKNVNRNDDRAIGNKNDNPLPVDTTRGTGSTSPHEKTPAGVTEKAKPEPNSDKPNTPNSMNADPSRPDASSSYNRSSNGGIGLDTVKNGNKQEKSANQKKHSTTHKGKVVTEGRNNTPTQQTGEEIDRKDAYRKPKQ